MFKFGKLVFVVGLVLLAISFSACRSGKNVSLENVFPADSNMVLVVDGSDDGQIENLKELTARFPDTGLWALFKFGLIQGLTAEGISYEEDFKPIFEGDWKVGFGMVFPEAFSADFSPEDFEVYFVFQTDGADVLANIIDAQVEKGIFDVVDGADAEYWTSGDEEFVLARYKDVFFVAINEQFADEAVARLKNGGGFVNDASVKSSLGYVYYDSGSLKTAFADSYKQMGLDVYADSFTLVDRSSSYLIADEGGFRTKSFTKVVDDEEMLASFGFVNIEEPFNLAGKVIGDDVVLYLEFAAGFGNFFRILAETADLLSAGDGVVADKYQKFIGQVADMGGLTRDALLQIFDSRRAIGVYDAGELVPGLVLYLDLEKSVVEDAKKLVIALDVYADEVIKELDSILLERGLPTGVLQKDVVTVNGAALHRIDFGFGIYPEDQATVMNDFFGFDVSKLSLEFSYGVTGDDVFVFALYPGFAADYGKSVLADDAEFVEALKNVGAEGLGVTYFRPAGLADLVMRYVEMAVAFNPQAKTVFDNYGKLANSFVDTITYMISVYHYGDGELTSDGFWKIGGEKQDL